MPKTDNISKNTFVTTLIPVRESKLLGKKLKFERSSALGFSPDTILRVIAEKSFLSHLEELEYDQYRALKALDRSLRTGSKLQKGTSSDLESMMESAHTVGGSPLTLKDIESIPDNLSAPWRIVRRTFFSSTGRTGQRLLARLAYYDRLTVEWTRSRTMSDRMERLARRFAPSIEYWNSHNLQLSLEAIALIDSTLQHLCWLDLELRTHDKRRIESSTQRLTGPLKRPVRHWFDSVLKELNLRDLLELHNHLTRQGALRHENVISHDLLKKWASSQRTLPYFAAKPLLFGCFGERAPTSVYAMDLWNAKILVFLTETICCFTAAPIDPLVAQSYIHERLKLLDMEFLNSRGKSSTSLFVV